MKKEIWKDIPEYEGIYEASTYGRIRTKEGKTTYSIRHGTRQWKSRILKGRGNHPTTGKRVSLWKNGEMKDMLVARLVAFTFLGIPKDKMTVNHKNGNRLDNRIENLEWLSLADNIRHGFETGLYGTQYKITLKAKDNSLHTFRSHSQASLWLGRCVGYIHECIKWNRKPKDIQGNIYEIIKEKNNG